MRLYHIHKSNDYDELYKEGAVIPAGSKLNQMRVKFLNDSSSYLKSSKKVDGVVHNNYESIANLVDTDKLAEMSEYEQIRTLEAIKTYVINSQLSTRELILEDVRLRKFKELPSRYRCMWLTDKDGLDAWIEKLNTDENTQVYEVEAEGNIFKTREALLPKVYIPYNDMYKQAMHYWNPSNDDLKNVDDREYLAYGEVKLLKRVK